MKILILLLLSTIAWAQPPMKQPYHMKLSWDPVPGAVGYMVLTCENHGNNPDQCSGEWVEKGISKETSILLGVDSPDTFFGVQAIDKSGQRGTATIIKPVHPTTTTVIINNKPTTTYTTLPPLPAPKGHVEIK